MKAAPIVVIGLMGRDNKGGDADCERYGDLALDLMRTVTYCLVLMRCSKEKKLTGSDGVAM